MRLPRSWRVATLAFPLVLVIWIAVASYRGQKQYRLWAEQTDRVYEILTNGQLLFSRLRDAETGQRGFLLTGRESYLEPYRRAESAVDQDFAKMRNLAAGQPGAAGHLERLEPLIANKRAELAETIRLYRAQERDAALAVMETDRGMQVMDQMRAELNGLFEDCRRELAVRAGAGNAIAVRNSLITGVGGTVLFLMLIVATVVIELEVRRQRADAQRILELNDTLEEKVLDRTRSLEESNRELEAFCSSVSHDLRAPLRSVEGFAKILLRDYPDNTLDARGFDLLHRLSAAAVRMGQLIDDLLKLSRISRAEVEPGDVDLGVMAARILEELGSREPARRVEIQLGPSLKARGDSPLLRIALENLLGNAWKFTRKQPRARIEMGRLPGGETPFYVRDNGAGFDMAHADQLFVPFQRLCRAADFEGSGIGLATVQRVVQRHRGRVWAESAPGRGATFYFTLNVEQEARAEGDTNNAAETVDSHGGGQPRRRAANA